MCPLIAAPNRGYADYQRVENWDSGVLISFSAASRNANLISSIQDVSRYAYLGGSMQETESQCSVLVQWFLDSNGTIRVGQRTFILTSLTTAIAQIRFPNLGPFVQVIVSPIGGATYTSPMTLFGTNRVHPLEFIPRNQALFNMQVFALAVGDNFFYPTDYYAGPVVVSYINAGAGQTVYHQILNPAGVWDYTEGHPVPGTNYSYESIMPAGAWRIDLNSTGVVGGLRFSVIPSTTGAS